MNRLFSCFFFFFGFIFFTYSQTCFLDGIIFNSQQKIDNFIINFPDCSVIEGDVVIQSNSGISNLAGLINIQSIIGNLTIVAESNLTTLEGLNTLDSVGGTFRITILRNLKNFTGLENLQYVGRSLYVDNNQGFKDFTGLERLKYIGLDLNIDRNDNLKNLKGLDSLTFIGRSLDITQNDSLVGINGLNALKKIGGWVEIKQNKALETISSINSLDSVLTTFTINSCASLTKVEGFRNLVYIGDKVAIKFNSKLKEVNGFGKLNTIGSIEIGPNDSLSNIDGFQTVNIINGYFSLNNNDALTDLSGFKNLKRVNGIFSINDNAKLENLSGLENLTFIERRISIDYNDVINSLNALKNLQYIGEGISLSYLPKLENLNGLENLPTINGVLWINNNDMLADISAISGLASGTITELILSDNPKLAVCEEKSICNFLNIAPDTLTIIENNLPYCNNELEVLAACEIRFAPLPSYQPLVLENATWIEVSNTDVYAESTDYFAYKIQGDSIANDKNYKKVYYYDLAPLTNGKYQLLQQNFRLLIREDTVERKVYGYPTTDFYGNIINEEFLINDFSLRIGENIVYYDFNYGERRTSKIIGDNIKLWFGKERRTLTTEDGIILIEGIGYYNGLLEVPTAIIHPVGMSPVVINYCRDINFNCNILTATTEPLPQKVNIYPNPTSTFIHIQFEQVFDGQIQLKTVTDKVIHSADFLNTRHEFRVTDLPKGIYFLHLQAKEGYLIKKVIIH